jgi:hypothetical protein
VDFALIERTAFASPEKPKTTPRPVALVAPAEPQNGRRPSRYKVERRSLESLLLERGVDYNNPHFDNSTWLPLDVFDDATSHLRTPAEWEVFIKDGDLRARALE